MKITNEFKIGITGLATLIILFFGIKFLKGNGLFSTNINYYAVYDNVEGMHISSYVYINGMKAGYIKDIEPMNMQNSKFLVELSIDKKLKIPKDSKLVLFDDGLLQGKALRIEVGTSNEMLQRKDTIMGYAEEGLMDALTKKISPMVQNLSSVILRIDTLSATLNRTFNEQTRQNIQSTIQNINNVSQKLEHITLNVDTLIDKDKAKLDNIVTNIESITKNVLTITDSIDVEKIKSTLNEVNTSLNSLSSSLKKIEDGKGNLGQLLNDEQLYNNLTKSAENLNLLIEDIKKNPKKYINIKLL